MRLTELTNDTNRHRRHSRSLDCRRPAVYTPDRST